MKTEKVLKLLISLSAVSTINNSMRVTLTAKYYCCRSITLKEG
jgi:hypothetical protein